MSDELTSAQRRFLRSTGRSRRLDVIIGKAGVKQSVLSHIRGQLAQHELVKVRLPASDAAGRAAAADEIVNGTGATLVDLVGRNAVLYKSNEQLPDEKRLHLPER